MRALKRCMVGIVVVMVLFVVGIFALDYFVTDPLDNPLIEKNKRIMARYICP